MPVNKPTRVEDITKIQDLTNDTGKTVQDLVKDAKDLDEAIHSIVSVLEDCQDYTDSGKALFEQYVRDLPGVQQNFQNISKYWDQITLSAQDNLSVAFQYRQGLDGTLSILRDITAEVQRPRSAINEQINLFKQSRDYAIRVIDSLKIQGGLEEAGLNRNIKRTQELFNQYKLRLEERGLIDASGNLDVKAAEAYAEAERTAALAAETDFQMHLRSRDLTRDQLEILKKVVDQHKLNAEYGSVANYYAMEGNRDNAVQVRDAARSQKRSHSVASIFGGIAKKAGIPEFNEYLENYDQNIISKQLVLDDLGRTEGDRILVAKNIESQVKKSYDTKKEAVDNNRYDLDINSRGIANAQLELSKLKSKSAFLEEQGASYTDKSKVAEEIASVTEKLRELLKERQNLKATGKELAGDLENSRKSLANATAEVLKQENAVDKANRELTDTKKNQVQLIKEGVSEYLKNLTAAGVALSLAIKIWQAFKQVNQDAAELKRHIGSWEIGSAAVNSKLATSADWLKTALDLTTKLGIGIAGLFTGDEIATVAEFKNLTGATAEQASNLAVRAKLAGQSAGQFRDAMTDGANAGNATNRSLITLRNVQDQVLNTSDAITLSFGSNGKALGQAAVAAANLGLNLEKVEGISKQLINFESSISNEMEAQLLTGMELNLSKAREYALYNDLEGVAKEIANQGITAQKFGSMNLIQQESMAKALGMSREELAKSLILRQLQNGADKEALAAAMHMKAEQIEAMSVQDRWKVATEKLIQAFTPILEVLVAIMVPVSKLVAFVSKIVGWISSAVGFTLRLFGLIGKGSQDLVDRALTFEKIMKGVVGTFTLALTVGPIRRAVGSVLSLAGAWARVGAQAKAAQIAQKIGQTGIGRRLGNVGGKISQFSTRMKNRADAYAAFGTTKTTRLGGNIASGAADSATEGASKLGNVFGGLGKNIGKIAVGVAAIALICAGTIALAKALQMMSGVKTKDVGNLLLGLAGITAAVMTIGVLMSGPQAGFMLLGAAAIGVVAVSMLALGVAVKKAAEGLSMLKTANLKESLTDLATGFGEFKKVSIPNLKPLSNGLKTLASSGIGLSEVASSVSLLSNSLRELNTQLNEPGFEKLDKLSLGNITVKKGGIKQEVSNKTEFEGIGAIRDAVETGFKKTNDILTRIDNRLSGVKGYTVQEFREVLAINGGQ